MAVPLALVLLFLCVTLAAQDKQEKKEEPQRPTFRSGAHYVRVDAYPTADGKPIPGLTAADFEILEDGKPQTIDRVEYIEFPEFTPLTDRRDPNSQRDAYALARDPSYRIFVLYLDAYHVDFAGSHRVTVPLSELLDRLMGPRDLFGMLTPAQRPDDLILGQLSLSIEEQLARHPGWGLAGREREKPEPGEVELEVTFPREAARLITLRRLDKVYSDLEGLIVKLGDIRDERKNIIFFSDFLMSPSNQFRDIASDSSSRGNPPGIGVGQGGKLTMGSTGRGDTDRLRMTAERSRLLAIDFDRRFRDLLLRARHANVSFYTVRPGGLDPNMSMMNEGYSNLQVLAEQTDGIAVVGSNDLRAGLRKVADDLSSHYVLGYYTANARWDGGTRRITVKLKSTGKSIRARREYRAPTEEEMASIRNAQAMSAAAAAPPTAGQAALSALARVSPAARVNAYGRVIGPDLTIVAEIGAAEIEGGRWKQGADVEMQITPKEGEAITANGRVEPGTRSALVRVPVGTAKGPWQAVVRMRGDDGSDSDTLSVERLQSTVLGKPLAYRAASAAASPFRPLAAFVFRRTERVRVEWPALQPIDTHSARLLDRAGKPLAIPLTTTARESNGTPVVSTDLNLAPLSNGDYVIEVSAKAGEKTETQVVAIRVSYAR